MLVPTARPSPKVILYGEGDTDPLHVEFLGIIFARHVSTPTTPIPVYFVQSKVSLLRLRYRSHYSFSMATTSGAGQSETPAVPPALALPEAAKLMQSAASLEETRFSNLNSRAIALLSATSLITALAGLFSRELLDTTKLGDSRTIVAWALLGTLVLLVVVATTLVWKVLVPSRRFIFGNNDLTNSPANIVDASAVHTVAFSEYLQIHSSLVERNRSKASALHFAYWVFVAAVIVIAIGAAAVAVNSM